MGPAYCNTQCRTLHFYCKTTTCEAARARAVATSACARVCSDLKRAMIAQAELARTLRGTLSFRMSAARISSQRSFSRTWNNRCCASRTPFLSCSTRRSFYLTLPSSAAMPFFSLSRLPSYTLIAPIWDLETRNLPRRHPAATWCMPASRESDDSKSAMVSLAGDGSSLLSDLGLGHLEVLRTMGAAVRRKLSQ